MNSIHRRFLIIAGLIAAGNGHAFELLHVDYGHSYFFVFNGGSDSGVREGMTACVDDDEGWELFCGKVVRVKTTVAAVEAPDNMEAWLEPGQRVRIEEMGAPKGRKRADSDETESDEEGHLEKPIDFSQRPITWPASYVATPVLPYQVQHPDFAVDTRINGSGSIWSGDSSTKRSLMGVSVGRRAPWSHTLDHEIDVTWRYIGPIKKEVDYDPNSANVYAVEQSKITDLGFSWNFLSPTLGDGLQWGWLWGLGFQYLTYAYSSSIVDDDGGSQNGDLAASQARMLALMGRGGLRL